MVAWLLAMTKPTSFKYFKTSPEIIRLALMLYIPSADFHRELFDMR